jgi:formylglycine-generating enzyme required for sulfatase activity
VYKHNNGKGQENYPLLRSYLTSLQPIPKGTFQMGTSIARSDASPKHSVRMSAFRMAATPVSVAVWTEYCASIGKSLPEPPPWGRSPDHPMVNISWVDIMGDNRDVGFCAWASKVAGLPVMLPTEAQFEYAARGGHTGWMYPWGNTFDNSKLWCSVLTKRTGVAPVNRTTNICLNGYKLSDMVGNVWQWCLDGQRNYESQTITDPQGSLNGVLRCVRGGTWWQKQKEHFTCNRRSFELADTATWHIGFRVVSPW